MAGFESKSINFILILLTVLFSILMCFLVNSLLLYFIFYECLTIMLFCLLVIFIPSFYRIRTSFFFFIFTIFGTISFIIAMLTMISSYSFMSLVIIIPFFIKIPTFPFLYWLPEVHCESNTSISLFLAGLLLKLSIYGILRFILSSFFTLRYGTSISISVAIIGIIISSLSCFRYFDLKKIITFSSILHLNLSLISILSLNSCGILSGIVISISHGLSSVSLFMFAGLLINKTYSRYLDSCYFINSQLRSLLLFFLLANLSFPLSINFIAEIMSYVAIVSIDSFVVFIVLLSNYISTIFWVLILNRKLPNQCCFSFSLGYVQLHSLCWLCMINCTWFICFLSLPFKPKCPSSILFYLLLLR